MWPVSLVGTSAWAAGPEGGEVGLCLALGGCGQGVHREKGMGLEMGGILDAIGPPSSIILCHSFVPCLPKSGRHSHTFCSQGGFSLVVGNQMFLPNASSQSCCRRPQSPGDQHFPRQQTRYQGLHVGEMRFSSSLWVMKRCQECGGNVVSLSLSLHPPPPHLPLCLHSSLQP